MGSGGLGLKSHSFDNLPKGPRKCYGRGLNID